MKIPCRYPGCRRLAVFRTSKCFDHGAGSEPTIGGIAPADEPIRTPKFLPPLIHDWDIICMLCADRRAARGTEADAIRTRRDLANVRCRLCGGALLVERGDIGAIGSPSAVHSAVYQPGYGVSTRPRQAA